MRLSQKSSPSKSTADASLDADPEAESVKDSADELDPHSPEATVPEAPSFALGGLAAVHVESSQEALCTDAEVSAAGDEKDVDLKTVDFALLPAYFDEVERKMRVDVQGCTVPVFGEVERGPRGFLLVVWPSGQTFETEVSNLALNVRAVPAAAASPLKKPAAASPLKRPAAADAKPAASPLRRPAAADAEAAASPLRRPAAADAADPAELPAAELEDPERTLRKKKPRGNAPGLEPVMDAVSPTVGRIKTYMSDEKAYIIWHDVEAGRWPSVVNLTSAMCGKKHKQFCKDIFAKLQQPGFGTKEANLRKDELISLAI
jgi:hypothetical protein